MHTQTTQILDRIKRGNGSATVRITVGHFASLLDDVEAMGRAAWLDAARSHLSTGKRSSSRKPKSEFEVLVGDLLATTDLLTKDVVRAMYDHLAPSLDGKMPARSRVRSIPKFMEHVEPLVGKEGLKKAVLAVQKQYSRAH